MLFLAIVNYFNLITCNYYKLLLVIEGHFTPYVIINNFKLL